MGRRPQERQLEFWIASESLAAVSRCLSYAKLNTLLDEAGFVLFVEVLLALYTSKGGRNSIPPGRSFQMLFVGYFEALDSQRGIAWRCADTLSLRRLLFLASSAESSNRSSLTTIRERLPLLVHERVFAFVLEIAQQKKLQSGTHVGVDATTLEANSAMKSIVRPDAGEDWTQYLIGSGCSQGDRTPQRRRPAAVRRAAKKAGKKNRSRTRKGNRPSVQTAA